LDDRLGGAVRGDLGTVLVFRLGRSAVAPAAHAFLSDLTGQAKFFNTAQRRQIGVDANAGPSPAMAVLITILPSTMRVFTGLGLATVISTCLGVAIRYFRLVEHLTLPAITLLAPVSPVAWLPVAIFLFGIGNGPAIFMVFVALFFHMILATITQIDAVNRNYINVARTMGAGKWQIYRRVILPAILPGLLVVFAVQPVRRLDGGADRRSDRRRLWPRPSHHDGAQYL
jgi:NitT/TauT family transport system permease protein